MHLIALSLLVLAAFVLYHMLNGIPLSAEPSLFSSHGSTISWKRPALAANVRADARTATKAIHVVNWNRTKEDLEPFLLTYFAEKNMVCQVRQTPRTIINVSFSCSDLFEDSNFGSGNWATAFYAMRLAAKVLGDVDIHMTCPDANESKAKLILPWIMGKFPSSDTVSEETRQLLQERVNDACRNFDICPVNYMYPEIKYEFRRMAVAMVGVPPPEHPTHAAVTRWLQSTTNQTASPDLYYYTLQLDWNASQPPLYPDKESGVELDDAVIHFRCGDLMESVHPHYGMMPYGAFADPISPDVRSIGIVTQPFEKWAQHRPGDKRKRLRERCRVVVMDFVDYLQGRFPHARIRVHNRKEDTVPLTYARMIMANQTIGSIGTFAVFPAIASFGAGYIRKPDPKCPNNRFLLEPNLDTLVDNVVLMDEPNMLMVRKIRLMWVEPNGQQKILSWFRNGSFS